MRTPIKSWPGTMDSLLNDSAIERKSTSWVWLPCDLPRVLIPTAFDRSNKQCSSRVIAFPFGNSWPWRSQLSLRRKSAAAQAVDPPLQHRPARVATILVTHSSDSYLLDHSLRCRSGNHRSLVRHISLRLATDFDMVRFQNSKQDLRVIRFMATFHSAYCLWFTMRRSKNVAMVNADKAILVRMRATESQARVEGHAGGRNP